MRFRVKEVDEGRAGLKGVEIEHLNAAGIPVGGQMFVPEHERENLVKSLEDPASQEPVEHKWLSEDSAKFFRVFDAPSDAPEESPGIYLEAMTKEDGDSVNIMYIPNELVEAVRTALQDKPPVEGE